MATGKSRRGGSSQGRPRKRRVTAKPSGGARKRTGSARKGTGGEGQRAGGARKTTGTPRKRTATPPPPPPYEQATQPPHYATGHGYVHFVNKNKTNTDVAAAALAAWGRSNLPQLGARFYSVSAMDDPFAASGPGQKRPKGDLVIALVMTSDLAHSHEAHLRIGSIATSAATALSQYFRLNANEPKHWCCWSDH